MAASLQVSFTNRSVQSVDWTVLRWPRTARSICSVDWIVLGLPRTLSLLEVLCTRGVLLWVVVLLHSEG